MSDLTEFLLARIAEDESVAREVQHRRQDGADAYMPGSAPDPCEGGIHSGEGDMDSPVVIIGPARVLAECESKRRIVGHALLLEEQAAGMPHDAANESSFEGQALAWRVALRELAQPYADHPDYREEWRA